MGDDDRKRRTLGWYIENDDVLTPGTTPPNNMTYRKDEMMEEGDGWICSVCDGIGPVTRYKVPNTINCYTDLCKYCNPLLCVLPTQIQGKGVCLVLYAITLEGTPMKKVMMIMKRGLPANYTRART